MAKFIFSDNYDRALVRIEDHLFSSTGAIDSVESFLDEHDKALSFIGENPGTPAVHPVTGDQSWVFSDGRYRLFFRCVEARGELTVHMTHLIDNKQLNSGV